MFGQICRKDQEALIQASYRYACALCPHAYDAEDLVHDAWIKVSARYGPLPDKALLFRAIRNRYIDRYRHAQRVRQVEFDERDSALYDVADVIDTDLDIDASQLMQALGKLRDKEREALFLAVIEGYTAEEISRLTDSPRSTALSLVHRAKIKLRTWLAEEGVGLGAPSPVKRAGS